MPVERREQAIGIVSGQLPSGDRPQEEPDKQWKAAAFTRWQEPDELRGSRPDLRETRGAIPRAYSASSPFQAGVSNFRGSLNSGRIAVSQHCEKRSRSDGSIIVAPNLRHRLSRIAILEQRGALRRSTDWHAIHAALNIRKRLPELKGHQFRV